MKKVYLAASAILVAGIAGAQMQAEHSVHKVTPFTKEINKTLAEGQDRAPGDPIAGGTDNLDTPANWTLTADVNGNVWTHANGTTPTNVNTYVGAMASTTASNGFLVFDGITDLLNSTVTPQDAAASYTPAINCTGITGVTLKFEQRYRAFNTDQTFVEVSGNNGVSYTQFEINTALPGNGPAVQEQVAMNISSIAGNQAQVKVRFRFFNSSSDGSFGSGYAWMIDDFGLYEAYNYDQQIMASYARSGIVYDPGLDYYLVPTAQITPITFSAKRENLGAVDQTGSKLNVTVEKPGVVYTGTSTPGTMLFNTSDSVGCTATYTPASGLGVYDITYWVDGTNTEEITSNDTMYGFIEVTDFLYSRDNDDNQGGIAAVSSNPTGVLQIGNVFEVFATDVIGAIDVAVSDLASNEGQLMYVQVYRYDGTDYVFVEDSPDYEIQAGDVGAWVKIVLNGDVDVTAGDDLLIVAGHYGGADPVEFYTAQGVDEGTVLGYIDGSLFFLTSPQAVMVRADMRAFSGIEETVSSNFAIGQNVPNPFDNSSVITYTLNSTSNVSVQITDVTGKVVQTITPGTQTAGTYTMTIDAATLADGLYFYTFTVGNEIVTKQMVVSKK